MAFRFQRRKRVKGGLDLNLGKGGVSMSKRGSKGSIGIGKNGPRASVKLGKGFSSFFR